MRSSKNKCLQEKAQSIQDALVQGKPSVVWQDICAIREYKAGLQPVQCSVIKKRDGVLCAGPEETLNRWRDHFEEVLNVISSYEQAALDDVRQLPIRSELAEPPNRDEVLGALGRLALGKACGINGLLPDVLK